MTKEIIIAKIQELYDESLNTAQFNETYLDSDDIVVKEGFAFSEGIMHVLEMVERLEDDEK